MTSSTTDTQRMNAARQILLAVLETIQEAGELGAPEGPLLLAVTASGGTAGHYHDIVHACLSTRLATRDGHCLKLTPTAQLLTGPVSATSVEAAMSTIDRDAVPTATADEEGNWTVGGVYVGRKLGDDFFAEDVASARWMIRSAPSATASAKRLGEAFGRPGHFDVLRLNGKRVGTTKTLEQAARLLRDTPDT